MPLKKAAANGEASEGAQAFKWEGANEHKLLLLIQGRHALPEEYEQLATAFPGVSTGAIRNRISNLRVKQRELYDSLGWTLPESGAANAGKRAPKATKKRGAADNSDANGDVAETPKTKKATKKRSADESDAAEETPKKKARGSKFKKEEESSGAEAEEGVKSEDPVEEEEEEEF